jgi:hypothetical protein
LLVFLPGILTTLAGKLLRKDANDTGADDFFGQVINDIAPHTAELVKGNATDSAADKAALAVFRTSEAYLKRRGKLPPPPPAD